MLEKHPLPESSAHFDISRLVALLRNICGLMPPHYCEWNPHGNWDNTIEVDIARLRDYKNDS